MNIISGEGSEYNILSTMGKYPGCSVCIIAKSYRRSRLVFDNLAKFLEGYSTRICRHSDQFFMEMQAGKITALPFGEKHFHGRSFDIVFTEKILMEDSDKNILIRGLLSGRRPKIEIQIEDMLQYLW